MRLVLGAVVVSRTLKSFRKANSWSSFFFSSALGLRVGMGFEEISLPQASLKSLSMSSKSLSFSFSSRLFLFDCSGGLSLSFPFDSRLWLLESSAFWASRRFLMVFS